jgi:hypothetical protein
MNDFMNSKELKKYLDIINEGHRRFNDLLVPLVEKLCYENSRLKEIKPTLSDILAEGSKRIDDAVKAVIARHEKEIADIEIKAKAELDSAILSIDRYGTCSNVDHQVRLASMAFGRSQYGGLVGMDAARMDAARMAQGQNRLFQQMNDDRRDAMNQAQDQFGRWI